MPVCTRICDPSDPFAQLTIDRQTKEDLQDLFCDNDVIFRRMNFDAFDIEDVDLSFFDRSYESDSDGECANSKIKKFRESRSHDCMWGGQCCNREFQRTQPPPPPPLQPQKVSSTPASTQPPVLITHSSQNKVVTIQKCMPGVNGKCDERTENVLVVTKNVSVRTPVVKSEGRSLLLNRTNVQNPSPVKIPQQIKREFPTPQSSRPETPQSISDSDDDDDLSPIPIDSQNTTIFRSALDALSTSSSSSTAASDWQDDLLLFSDSRGRRTNPPAPAVKPQSSCPPTDLIRLSASANSDHNYDSSSKNFSTKGLGVETPSDSEEDEEIDVVSLSERSSSSRSSSCSGLPTRPTQRDQRHLEEITTSLLSASEAVSRKIRQTFVSQQTKFKRKKYQSESSEDDDDDEDDYEEDDESIYQKYHRQIKRQKPCGTQSVRRKRSNTRFGVEEDSQEKRDLHNNMERMRRIDLRNSFEELKAMVPTVSNKDRAAKVVILKEAANYCHELQADSQSKCMQVMALRKEQERLRGMVSSLRKAAAAAITYSSTTSKQQRV